MSSKIREEEMCVWLVQGSMCVCNSACVDFCLCVGFSLSAVTVAVLAKIIASVLSRCYVSVCPPLLLSECTNAQKHSDLNVSFCSTLKLICTAPVPPTLT